MWTPYKSQYRTDNEVYKEDGNIMRYTQNSWTCYLWGRSLHLSSILAFRPFNETKQIIKYSSKMPHSVICTFCTYVFWHIERVVQKAYVHLLQETKVNNNKMRKSGVFTLTALTGFVHFSDSYHDSLIKCKKTANRHSI